MLAFTLSNVWIVIKKYKVETSSKVQKRIYKRKRNLIKENTNNGMVKYNFKTNHVFNFKDFKMLVYIYIYIYIYNDNK